MSTPIDQPVVPDSGTGWEQLSPQDIFGMISQGIGVVIAGFGEVTRANPSVSQVTNPQGGTMTLTGQVTGRALPMATSTALGIGALGAVALVALVLLLKGKK